MADRKWVEQVRELLGKARQQHKQAFAHLGALRVSIEDALQVAERARREASLTGAKGPPYPIRRKQLLAQIALKSKHYALNEEIQAFVSAAGAQVIQELDNEQLEALHAWLARNIDAMETACDSAFAPPAR